MRLIFGEVDLWEVDGSSFGKVSINKISTVFLFSKLRKQIKSKNLIKSDQI